LLKRTHAASTAALFALQLATGDFDDRWGPTETPLCLEGTPSIFSRTVQIAAGLQHTLALVAHKGRVKPFAAGELHDDAVLALHLVRLKSAAVTAAVCHMAGLFDAGANVWGQLGTGNQTPSNRFVLVKGLPADVVALQAGGSSSGAICESGSVYVWGRNDWGMLGLGNTTSKWSPVLVKGMVAVHPGD
jgi:alpha-tubulin suppressor-like RCC1 family protein